MLEPSRSASRVPLFGLIAVVLCATLGFAIFGNWHPDKAIASESKNVRHTQDAQAVAGGVSRQNAIPKHDAQSKHDAQAVADGVSRQSAARKATQYKDDAQAVAGGVSRQSAARKAAQYKHDAPASESKTSPQSSDVSRPQLQVSRSQLQLSVAKLAQAVEKAKLAEAQHRSKWQLQLSDLQRDLSLAELACERYRERTLPEAKATLLKRLALAKKKTELARQRAAGSEKLADRGLISLEQLGVDKTIRARELEAMKSAQGKLDHLLKTTSKRQLAELESQVESLRKQLELDRRSNQLQSDKLADATGLAMAALASEQQRLANSPAGATDSSRRLLPASDSVVSSSYKKQLAIQQKELKTATQNLSRSDSQRRLQREKQQIIQQDLARKLAKAKTQRSEYFQRQFKERSDKHVREIGALNERLQLAQQKLKWSDRVLRKRYITQSAQAMDSLSVSQISGDLELAKFRLQTLKTFGRRKAKLENDAHVQRAELEMKLSSQVAQQQLRLSKAKSHVEAMKVARLSEVVASLERMLQTPVAEQKPLPKRLVRKLMPFTAE